jgi:uncharacterized membrane protein
MGIDLWVPILFFVFGLFSACLTPIGQVGDEPYHYLRAYHVSRGHFVIKEKVGEWGGAQLPTSLGNLIASSFGLRETWHRVYIPEWNSFWSLKLDRSVTSPHTFGTASQNTFVPYLGAALAMRVTSIVDDRPIVLFYTARIANLVIVTLIFHVCLRLLPFGHLAVSAIILMPLTIAQCASLSIDAFNISFAVLLTSLLVHMASQRANVSWQQLSLVQCLGLVVGLCKFPYALLTGLVFLIQPSRLGGIRKALAVQFAVIAVSVGMGVIATKFQSKSVPQPFLVMGQYEADVHKQLEYILESPGRIVPVIAGTVYRDTQHWLAQPSSLGWAVTPLPYGSLALFLGMFAASRLDETQRFFPNGGPLRMVDRLLMLGLAMSIGSVVILSFYLWYSPVGGQFAEGVLFRYAIPVLPLMSLACLGRGYVCETRMKRDAFATVVSYSAALEVAALLTVYSRFWPSEPPQWFTPNMFIGIGVAVFFAGMGLFRILPVTDTAVVDSNSLESHGGLPALRKAA